jgi:hypothetical protein
VLSTRSSIGILEKKKIKKKSTERSRLINTQNLFREQFCVTPKVQPKSMTIDNRSNSATHIKRPPRPTTRNPKSSLFSRSLTPTMRHPSTKKSEPPVPFTVAAKSSTTASTDLHYQSHLAALQPQMLSEEANLGEFI